MQNTAKKISFKNLDCRYISVTRAIQKYSTNLKKWSLYSLIVTNKNGLHLFNIKDIPDSSLNINNSMV